MGKYIVLGTITGFWLLLPFVFSFVGIDDFSFISTEQLSLIKAPESTLNAVGSAVNYFSFFFRVLTVSLPNAPKIVSYFLLLLLVISVLAIVSVLRGD